jgi:hypothetical protein
MHHGGVGVFGQRDSGSGASEPRCPTVIVRQASLRESADPQALAQDVVAFVNHAAGPAMFRREELPQEALRAFHVDFYVAQVNNGGHGQFAHNSRWEERVLRDIEEGLARLDVPEAVEIFGSFRTFAVAEPVRFRRTFEGSGFGDIDPFVERLDRRYYDGVGRELSRALRDWIAGWACLRPLDDHGYRAAMHGLPECNPERAARESEARRQVEAQRAADPLHQTLRFVCHVTPPGLRFERLMAASPQSDKDGPGASFRIATDRGLGRVFFYGGRAALLLDGEEKVRSKIPFAMIDGFLARQSLSLPDTVKRGEMS